MTAIGSAGIECVFDVTYRLDVEQKKRQHVVLLKDDSYICTCLLLQHSGIVYRHYFHLMQIDRRFKYHIKLIPRRWYKEHLQDSVDLEETFGPFLFATTQNTDASEDQTADTPDATYMSGVFKFFPLGIPSHKTTRADFQKGVDTARFLVG